jgi:hypothetical protein
MIESITDRSLTHAKVYLSRYILYNPNDETLPSKRTSR